MAAEATAQSYLGRMVRPGPTTRPEIEAMQRLAWRDRGFFAISEDDPRLSWDERELIRRFGDKLHGKRGVAK